MSILLSHSSVAPFVQQAARALHEAGWLDRFHTAVRYDPASRGQRTACALARILGFDLATQLRRRAITELPLERVVSHPLGEWLRLATGRFNPGGRLLDLVWEQAEIRFDRTVARRLRPQHTAVYGFEFGALETFRRARALGKRTIYDVPAPEPQFVKTLLDQELAQFPELRTPYHRHTDAREGRRTARRRAEWQSADVVIAASRFTRDSFASTAASLAKVRVVPYGAPPPLERSAALVGGSAPSAPLSLLWAGTFSIRKGAHYVLEAWRRGRLGRHARLRIFGTQALPERLLAPLPDGIEFGGSIPRDRLVAEYRSSDALLFPTLCDGFGMVATEAWASGVPVITTPRAGAADLLAPEQNGLLVPAASADAIVAAVEWCLTHRAELRAMREAALATAARWQWSDYRAALRSALAPQLGTSAA